MSISPANRLPQFAATAKFGAVAKRQWAPHRETALFATGRKALANVLLMFALCRMHRINRDMLFHRIVGAIQFDSELRREVPNRLAYAIADKVCDLACNDSVMVIEAGISGFNMRATGKFGTDEPWPEWADRSDLLREGLIAPAETAPQGNDPQR